MKYQSLLCVHALALTLLATPTPAATITVTTTDNGSGPGDGQISLDEALRSAVDGDTIAFKIPGAGPHFIVTPLGGYPLISANNLTIDGYTQPGSAPNTNPILGGNNARIKIVLDSTSADSAANDPQDPSLLARRSTRILHSGYGDSENGVLAVLGGDNFTVRGISFIGRHTAGNTDDPSIYCVALVNQATNARVQGCWFGLAPGGSTQADLKPAAAAVAGFRYRDGGDVYSEGLIVGTDGDGVNDRAEFNVILGCRIGLALELPGARIAGNYFNVFPDGLHFVDVDAVAETIIAQGPDAGEHVENIENGRVTDGTVIGTNGDGVSDSDERNIFAHASYDHDVEFYSSAKNAVIAGNYFGVGVDGVTVGPIPALSTPDLAELPGNGSVRLGSNGDGVSDDLEGNLIHSVPGSRLVIAGSGVPIVARRNKMVNNNTRAVPFADGENAVYASYYAPFLADVSAGVAPVLQSLSGGILTGTLPAPSAGYPNAVIDLYRVDPAALAKTNFWPAALVHPLTWLGSYTDNGPGDLDPDPNKFSINVNAFGLSDTTYLAAAASYSTDPALFNGTNAVTSPMSNPISARPSIAISLQLPTGVELSWLGPDGAYKAQINNNVGDTGGWAPVGPSTYTGGRNVIITGFDPFPETIIFYRLINQ